MNTEIINIGNELLIGQVINTNSSYMSKILNSNGFSVNRVSVIADDRQAILQSVNDAMQRSEIVLITGGLGPTKDDITKQCLCELFGGTLSENQEVSRHVEKIFTSRNLPYTPTNRSQAFLPTSCKPIFNHVGTAPGMVFEKEGKTVISLPGVPFEMKNMMNDVLELLLERYNPQTIIDKNIVVAGISESFLSDMLEDFEERLDKNKFSLAYLPNGGLITLRLSLHGGEREEGKKETELLLADLKSIIAEFVVGEQDDDLPKIVSKELKKRNATLSLAESCTGGNIAHRITLLSGASEVFKGSVVAYNNRIKNSVLGVEKDILEKHHAVSLPTVIAMAKGSLRLTESDYAVSTSGLAGPNSDGTDVPVGTVCICAMNKEGKHLTFTTRYNTTRENFIDRVSNDALMLLIKLFREEDK
ncbi:MAG: CinA family nicotinamide mononucleotide deamidase-related protein [Bacteroidales bacterium]|nr:CinA family nicotinamide mononucleotide deamidase-related protein [Bacteroidales bacterium]